VKLKPISPQIFLLKGKGGIPKGLKKKFLRAGGLTGFNGGAPLEKFWGGKFLKKKPRVVGGGNPKRG